MLFSSKPKKLPAHWPSPLHNKCNNPRCSHANDPQPVSGKYTCMGVPGGYDCTGTYKVTPEAAARVDRKYKERFQREADQKRKLDAWEKLEKARKELEMERQIAQWRASETERKRRVNAERMRHDEEMLKQAQLQHVPAQPLERRSAQRKRTASNPRATSPPPVPSPPPIPARDPRRPLPSNSHPTGPREVHPTGPREAPAACAANPPAAPTGNQRKALPGNYNPGGPCEVPVRPPRGTVGLGVWDVPYI